MSIPISLTIGWRYIRAKRRHQFISFISAFSLIGMVLGVMSLLIVLSVMNGFDREIKQRILHVIPHGFLEREGPMLDSDDVAKQALTHPGVIGAFPFIDGHGLLSNANIMQGVELRGVEQSTLDNRNFQQYMVVGEINALMPGEYGVIIGRLLARQLGLSTGDQVMLTLPQLTVTPAGIFPRVKRMQVVGVFEVGAQPDQNLVLINLNDAQKLFRLGRAVDGVEIETEDMYAAQAIVRSIASEYGHDLQARDWTQTQGSLFTAVKMEKTVITVLLLIIVAVAAFNIISSLVLMVADKRLDIAVLRTLGMTRWGIMQIFMTQGFSIGLFGVLIGAFLGSLIAIYIGDLVQWFEAVSGIYLFDPNVYFISQLPSEWRVSDLLLVCGIGLVLSFVSTLYPAWRASRIEPAEALRYE